MAHALKAMPDAGRLLLIVDQFEETFTLADPAENEPFQTALLRLAEVPGAFVVLTARADFYDKLMAPPRVLWEQIQTHRVEVLSLDNKRLAQAIVEPARVRGVYIDPLLVQRLLADAALEPAVLPLVQETMVLMWERLERRYLSLRDYESLVPPLATGSRKTAACRTQGSRLRSSVTPGWSWAECPSPSASSRGASS